MIKLVGSLCVLFAGGSVWWLQHQEQRRRRQVLAELAAALDYMETSIRLNRTPLLPLFRQAARGRCHEAVSYTHLDVYKRQPSRFFVLPSAGS